LTKGPRLGRGRTAEVFVWGDDRALKLFFDWAPAAWVEAEAARTRAAHAAGLAAPAVEGVVEVDGRRGIVFERVEGPTLLNRIAAQPWRLAWAARRLAELQAQMHAVPAPDFPSQREELERKIRSLPDEAATVKERALAALAQLPDGDSLCHGDFHPDNVVLTARGPIVIDWAATVRGHPLADAARTSLLLQVGAVPPGTPGRWLIEAGRALFHRLYLRRYLQLRRAARTQLEVWRLPIAAARLEEGIPEERAWLLALVRERLRR